MSASLSIFLDLLRFLAAVSVVVGHLTQRYFSAGWPDLTLVGIGCVAVFFVLSGFVIEHTATLKFHGFEAYLVARLARIYSVLVPAVALTFVADGISSRLDPAFYFGNWGYAVARPLTAALANLSFVSQAYGRDIPLLTNSPTWSLGYEVPFYLVFGAARFLPGPWRSVLWLAIAAALGPNIFVLFPVWLAGAWLYGRLRFARPVPALGVACLLGVVAIGFAAPTLWRWDHAVRHVGRPLSLLWRGRSEHVVLFHGVGLATCLLIVAAHSLQRFVAPLLEAAERPIRSLASATFSIYLYHFPLLVLLAAATHYDRTDPLAKTLVFAATLGACFGLSRLTETRKDVWVRGIGRLVAGVRRLAAHAVG